MAVNEVIDIAIQIAQGLVKAHEHGIIHRDIKPSNIMVTKDGIVKILDFGLAKLAGQVGLTKTGTTIGTIAYMSPEQARGEDVDHRTVIWCFGVVLYEMLTGKLPFRGEYDQAVVYSILNEQPEPITSQVPLVLENIIVKMLEKKRDDRYQQSRNILNDLLRSSKINESSQQKDDEKFKNKESRRPSKIQLFFLGFASVVTILIIIFSIKIFNQKPIEQILATHKQITFIGNVSHPYHPIVHLSLMFLMNRIE